MNGQACRAGNEFQSGASSIAAVNGGGSTRKPLDAIGMVSGGGSQP